MQQAITWANVDLDLCRHRASLGHNELTMQDKEAIVFTKKNSTGGN